MVKNKNIAVKVEHVSKSFKLPTESSQSLRTTLVNLFKGIKGYVEYNVLQDISFEVEKGDFFGIVGRNGSGTRRRRVITSVRDTDMADLSADLFSPIGLSRLYPYLPGNDSRCFARGKRLHASIVPLAYGLRYGNPG